MIIAIMKWQKNTKNLLNRYAALDALYRQQEQFEDAFSDYKDRTNVTFKMTGISAADRACDGTCKRGT